MIGWLFRYRLTRWIVRRWVNRRDPAWAPTGIRQVYSGHDERKQETARHRIAQHDRDKRRLADARVNAKGGKVREFPREASR